MPHFLCWSILPAQYCTYHNLHAMEANFCRIWVYQIKSSQCAATSTLQITWLLWTWAVLISNILNSIGYHRLYFIYLIILFSVLFLLLLFLINLHSTLNFHYFLTEKLSKTNWVRVTESNHPIWMNLMFLTNLYSTNEYHMPNFSCRSICLYALCASFCMGGQIFCFIQNPCTSNGASMTFQWVQFVGTW